MKKNSYKLNQILVIPFALMISFAIVFTGYFTWKYSESFALDSGENINRQTLNCINTQIDFFFHHAAMENNGFKRVINHDLLDIDNQTATFQYMFEILNPELSHGIIDNLHIGYPNGDYIGVESSENGIFKRVANDLNFHTLQIIRPSDHAVIAEKSNYYAQDTDWYKKAMNSKQAVWSDVYPIFGTGELGMTLSEKIYNSEGKFVGVVGSDFLLSSFNKHISELQPTENSLIFIIDSDRNLIAKSGDAAYPVGKQLLNLENSEDKLLSQAEQFINQSSNTDTVFEIANLTVNGRTENYWVSYTPFGAKQGLDWHIGIIVPESDLIGHVRTVEIRTFFIWLAAFSIAILLGLLITHFINFSIQHLNNRVKKVKDSVNIFEHSDSPIEEVNDLSVAFSQMSYQLQEMFLDLKNTNVTLEKIVEERTTELKAANEELAKLTKTDKLTSLLNRRGFDEAFKQLWSEFQHPDTFDSSDQLTTSVVCMIADVDGFKQFNDYYGRQKGDNCLIHIAELLNKIIDKYVQIHKNKQVYIARVGGEEFFIAFSNYSLDDAHNVAKEIIKGMETLNIPNEISDIKNHVTLSIGLSYIDADMLTSGDYKTITQNKLIHLADAAMYRAKSQGKNQICISEITEND